MPIEDDDLIDFPGGPLAFRKKESDIERAGVDYAVARGWKHKKIGTNAWPDHLFIKAPRQVVWVEFKRRGKQPRANQKRRLAEIADMGFRVYVVDRKEQYAEVFGA